MKKKISYICECCGKEYQFEKDALSCEAKDYGLTLEQYQQYLSLLEKEERTGINMLIAPCEQTEMLFEEAYKELEVFMIVHNMKKKESHLESLLTCANMREISM